MSFDQQVRSGLIANAAHVDPDTEGALVMVLGRARRRRQVRHATVAFVAAVAVLVGVSWLPNQIDLAQSSLRPVAPATSRPVIPFGAGSRVIDLDRVSAARHGFPVVELTVPQGWSDLEHRLGRWGVWTAGKDGNDFLAVSVWEGWMVLRHQHPCTWFGYDWTPGGAPTEHPDVTTLTELVRAAGVGVTDPVSTTLGEVPAQYLEYTLPADYQCRSRAGIPVDPLDKTWTDPTGALSVPDPGQVHQLWILTLAGTSVLIDATHTTGANASDIDTLTGIVDSLEFTPATPAA